MKPARPPRDRSRTLRQGVLLLVLLGVALWSARQVLLRERRRDWRATVQVDVILLRKGPVSAGALSWFVESLPRLERLFAEEYLRHRGERMPPFSFQSHGPVDVGAPPPPPPDGGVIDRLAHFFALRSYFQQVEKDGGLTLRRHSLRLYVLLMPVVGKLRFVEGFGAAGGDFGVVQASVDERTVDQALIALGHETLHCLGALDKYDESGHAVEPEGLVEPALAPRYPQRFAEIMVGERPLGPGQGRLCDSLAEARVGPFTAVEIGWVKGADKHTGP